MGMLLLLVFGFLVAMLRAKILMSMWVWFIVPLGAPSLSFGIALGLMFTLGLIRGVSFNDLKERETAEHFMHVFMCVIHAFMALGFGWFIKTAMLIGAG